MLRTMRSGSSNDGSGGRGTEQEPGSRKWKRDRARRREPANVVLTGLPRSGTTLACRLLNTLPDTVALHEPIAPGRFADAEDEQAVLEGMERFFRRMRRMIRREKVAVSKNVGGKIPDNAYEHARSGSGLRPRPAGREPRRGRSRRQGAGGNFLLVVKQPALFSALLPVLAQRFPCYAVVRNPLSVLASWNSVDHKVREGHSRGAELSTRGLEASWLPRKTASDGSCSYCPGGTSAFTRRFERTTSFATKTS